MTPAYWSGRRVADRVGDVDGGRAGLDGGLDDFAEEVDLGPRGVLGAELDVRAAASGLAHARDSLLDDLRLLIRSLCSRWIADVARKTWIRGFWANWIASQARSMSRSLHRARPQTDCAGDLGGDGTDGLEVADARRSGTRPR